MDSLLSVTETEPRWCEHGPGQHDGGVPSHATAPAGSRAWLLIEHYGLWEERAVQTALPAPLAMLAVGADERGIRVQLIRRPGRRDEGGGRVFAGWTVGVAPWLVETDGGDLDLAALAAGERVAGAPVNRLYLVCAHARRDRCCGRFGAPLARALAAAYPDEVWESTHVGGHKFAANLVLLPHGLYYGPTDLATATRAIGAYQRGEVIAHRYRGRAGQETAVQEAEYATLAKAGAMTIKAVGGVTGFLPGS
jgi:hypothetical protein